MTPRAKAIRDVRDQLARRYTVVHLSPELAEALLPPLTGKEQVWHNGKWVDVLTMPNFDAHKEYKWRKTG